MQVSWLHVSDFHIRGGDPYDRDVVLKTLVKSVRYFREQGHAPDLILATGDIAHAADRSRADRQDAQKIPMCRWEGFRKIWK